MKAKIIFSLFVVAALAGGAGWFAARQTHSDAGVPSQSNGGRKIKYYQSSMHPWVISNQPGKCTVCGMALVPIYEGDKGFSVGAGVVALGSNGVQIANVQTEVVGRHALQSKLRVAGIIEYNDTRLRRLAAGVDGRLEKLFVSTVGTEVVAGQALATVYSTTMQAAAREYLTLVRQNLPISAPPELLEERSRQRLVTQQRLLRFGLLETQIAELENHTNAPFTFDILSPINGTLVQRDAAEGQYLKDGDKLCEIVDLYAMWFSFDVYEKDLAWIHTGQLVDITTTATPGKTYTFPIALIDPNISDPTRSAKVRVALQNPAISVKGKLQRDFFHKLYAEGLVKLDFVADVLAVPRQAVLNTGSRVIAYVDLGGGNFEQRPIKLGRHSDTHWEILAGLKDGERVVTAGNLLMDGQAQLNQSIAAPSETSNVQTSQAPNLSSLNLAQLAAAKQFVNLADALGVALAGDNLADFNRQAMQLPATISQLTTTFAEVVAWKPLVDRLSATIRLDSSKDLPTARKAFLAFTEVATTFAKALRAQSSELATLKIYQCPMTDKAIPGAPKKSEWLQLQGPIRNPFFGTEMLDCGSEVKP